MKTPAASLRIRNFLFAWNVWISTLVVASILLNCYLLRLDAHQVTDSNTCDYLVLLAYILLFRLLFALPLFACFWMGVYTAGNTRYTPQQRKGLLCLCLLCLYLVFPAIFSHALPEICHFLGWALHSYLIIAIAFTWLNQLPAATSLSLLQVTGLFFGCTSTVHYKLIPA